MTTCSCQPFNVAPHRAECPVVKLEKALAEARLQADLSERQFWEQVALTVAGAWNCNSSDRAAVWADELTAKWRERFAPRAQAASLLRQEKSK